MRSRHSREELEQILARAEEKERRDWEKKLGVDDLRTENARLTVELRDAKALIGSLEGIKENWKAKAEAAMEAARSAAALAAKMHYEWHEALAVSAHIILHGMTVPFEEKAWVEQLWTGELVERMTLNERLECVEDDNPDGQPSIYYEYQRHDGYVARGKTMLEALQAALKEEPEEEATRGHRSRVSVHTRLRHPRSTAMDQSKEDSYGS